MSARTNSRQPAFDSKDVSEMIKEIKLVRQSSTDLTSNSEVVGNVNVIVDVPKQKVQTDTHGRHKRQEDIAGVTNKDSLTKTSSPRKIPLRLYHWDSLDKECKYDGPLSIGDFGEVVMEQNTSGNQNMKIDKKTSAHCNDINGSHGNPSQLSEKEVVEKATVFVKDLSQIEDYHRGDGMRIQKSLGDLYWDYSNYRRAIGDAMAAAGYAVAGVKMLKSLNTIGIFKNDDIWFPTYYAYNTMWNYSDSSSKLSRSLAEADATRLLTLNCSHKPYLNAMHSKNVYYVMKASLSILHNIARIPDVKHYFKDSKTSEIIGPFISSSDDFLKAISMLTLAYIVEEEDNSKLIQETDTIRNILKWTEKALDSSKRRYRGFTPQELLQGIDKLGVNDSNKMKIVEEGVLPIVDKMLNHDDWREQKTAARLLWTISFDKNVRQKCVDHANIVPSLEKILTVCDKDLVKKHVQGALWLIKGDNNVSRSKETSNETNFTRRSNHIYISYHGYDEDRVREIVDKLRAEGYAVIVNYESHLSIQQTFEVIETAALVLISMSEKFKQSPLCRTECELTQHFRKDYIPLMMQPKYHPDGWLGNTLGAKLFYDFSGRVAFDKSMQGLHKELKGRTKLTRQSSVNFDIQEQNSGNKKGTVASGSNPGVHSETSMHAPNITSEQVYIWLKKYQLDTYIPEFTEFDWKLLKQFKDMKQEAPEFFYNCLEKKLKMPLVDILRFSNALENISLS